MKTLLGFILFISFLKIDALAQGCSDSGFCTMGAIKPDQPFEKKFQVKLNSIEVTHHYGYTKFGDNIHSTFIDANISLGKIAQVQARLPAYTTISGNMPTTRGWGDVFVNLSKTVLTKYDFQVSVTAGAKLHTSKPDKSSAEGEPMPLYHQTTIGTNDINIGGSLVSRKWMFAIGYQRVLNRVENKFTHDAWNGSALEEVVINYDPSAGLRRGDDLMLRSERNIRLSRINIYAGTLALWRLTSDETINESNTLQKVRGSRGLALNFVMGGGFQFNTSMGIRVLTSFKLKERKANPDGLSRNFISQVAYIIRF